MGRKERISQHHERVLTKLEKRETKFTDRRAKEDEAVDKLVSLRTELAEKNVNKKDRKHLKHAFEKASKWNQIASKAETKLRKMQTKCESHQEKDLEMRLEKASRTHDKRLFLNLPKKWRKVGECLQKYEAVLRSVTLESGEKTVGEFATYREEVKKVGKL